MIRLSVPDKVELNPEQRNELNRLLDKHEIATLHHWMEQISNVRREISEFVEKAQFGIKEKYMKLLRDGSDGSESD